jgi:hypothetical protein
MRELERPVARVFRRLRVQRFVTTLVWSWAIALFIVAGLIGAEKIFNQHIPGPDWVPFAVAGLVGMAVAAGVSLSTGPSRMDAAVALDRVFHLNERVSSAFSLPADLRETAAGKALIADAARKVSDLDVAAEFGLRLPRRAWVVLIPATATLLLLFAPAWVPRSVQAKMTEKIDTKAIAKQTELLTKKIASQRQAIDKEKFPEAEKLLAKIEKKAEELAKAPPAAKDKLMVELNALSDALKDRQKQLKEMAKQGPADQFAKDLARGDFKKAADQLQKLQEKMKSGKMSETEKKELKEQLAEMSKKLGELANLEQRKKQLEEAKKNGGLTEQQYQREMDKLNEQSKSLKQLSQLASKLGDAAKALEKGDAKKAADSLGMTQQQMSEMAKQLDEMQSLDAAMADLQDAKNGMAPDGMNQIGSDMNSFGMGMGLGQRKGMGNGLGRGRGQGDRPEAPDETALYTSKVQQQLKKGKAVSLGFTTPGKTVKGDAVIDVQGEIDAGAGSVADALSNQKIPRNLEKHIRSYYDQLNKGN